MTRLVFLDTETTSLDDTRGEVWEIAVIVRDEGMGDTEFLWQLRPDLSTADPNSLRISRFYERNCLATSHDPAQAVELFIEEGEIQEPRVLDDARTTVQVALDLARFLDGAHVVGAVPDFDYRFLRRFMAKNGQCWTAHYHLIDVEALAVGWLYGLADRAGLDERMAPTGLPWKSKDLYRAVGVDPDRHEEHTALGDARLVRDVYDAITGAVQAEPQDGEGRD